MIAGKQYVGPIADIWSLGVILFAMVCGFLPFEDANTPNLYRKIMAGEYKPAKWISSDVSDLIKRILETDPRRRYSVADIRQHRWYQMVPESALPKDIPDSAQVKADTMQAMADAGMDVQAVLDGIQSHACNSVTAMYYLLAQKMRSGGSGGAQRKVALDKDNMQNLLKTTAESQAAQVPRASQPPSAAQGPPVSMHPSKVAAVVPPTLAPTPTPALAPTPVSTLPAGQSNQAPSSAPEPSFAGALSNQNPTNSIQLIVEYFIAMPGHGAKLSFM